MKENRERIIEQLRKHVTIPGKQATSISTLTDQQLYHVYTMMMHQETCQHIAKHIQTAWKLYTSTTPHSLAQSVMKLKRRIAHLLIVPVEEQHGNPSSHSGFRDKTSYPSATLEDLAEKLQIRIDDMLAEEKQTGLRFPLNKEITALSSLRKTILKEKKFEIEHGKDDPTRLRRQLLKERHMKRQFDDLLNSLPDQGARVVEAGEQLFKLLEENSIPMKYDEERGAYSVNPADLRPEDY